MYVTLSAEIKLVLELLNYSIGTILGTMANNSLTSLTDLNIEQNYTGSHIIGSINRMLYVRTVEQTAKPGTSPANPRGPHSTARSAAKAGTAYVAAELRRPLRFARCSAKCSILYYFYKHDSFTKPL